MILPTLALGARGPHVATLQALLSVEADGSFGRKTQTAVSSYQLSQGLDRDGICGPATWAALTAAAPYLAPCDCPPGQHLPVEGYRRQHGRAGQTWAIDLPTPIGTQIESPCPGRVSRTSDRSDPYNGIGVWIEPVAGPLTRIALIHLSALAVEVGQEVAPGQLLGLSGSTGASTGPHLHLEIAPELDPLALFRWAERGWT